jgi:alpha-glucuronidase
MKVDWLTGLILLFAALCGFAPAEDGSQTWLRYAPLTQQEARHYASLPSTTVVLGRSTVFTTAQHELIGGVRSMLGRTLRAESALGSEPAIVLATIDELEKEIAGLAPPTALNKDGYWLTHAKVHGSDCLVVAAVNDRGVLYGVFALLRKISLGEQIQSLNEGQQPAVRLRWVNQWDNLDGHIERGYAGPSIFFENGNVRADLHRAGDYARILASVGINGCTVNNVNANPQLLTDPFLPELARIADAFRPWGVQLSLAIDLSSPKSIGGLDTFDPLDARVAEWWKHRADQIYHLIPDFGGFVMKADSEGRPGPSSFGRTPADAANVIARALQAHGGVVFYRAFVYDHHLDWRNLKNDRARAAYDIFHPLDGKFDDNVIIQIKYGPIDFQVREPASPLFGGLSRTNEAIELQITQEYTGQQRHLCFLAPLWKEILDFDIHAADGSTLVKDLVAGRVFHRPTGGFVGVANVGMDTNWMRHPLALANLYAFGRLAWNPDLTSEQIVEEWTRQTFGNDPLVVQTIDSMQLSSWRNYEDYTGPLGVGTLTNILGPHYGPGPESSEKNGWGQWHRADHQGIGMDRTIATGTGFIGQYSPRVQNLYENVADCPDDLLLFFHHVAYTHIMHSGKTVIQSMYDSHYAGAGDVAQYVPQWESLHGKIDEDRYKDVLGRLRYQAGHAIVWRDAIWDWLLALTGIPDDQGRVGHHPDRIEAENMQLNEYLQIDITPAYFASAGRAVSCPEAQSCAASFAFKGSSGAYELDIQYFDLNNGVARFSVLVNSRPVDEWQASDDLPSAKPDGDTSTRRTIPSVALHSGDKVTIRGTPGGGDTAILDYVAIQKPGMATSKDSSPPSAGLRPLTH